MTRRLYAVVAAFTVALVAGGVWLAANARAHGAGSTLSLGADGWLAARRYLEARGCSVTLLDEPAAAGSGVLVVVFPWQTFDGDRSQASLQRHLQRGGTIVLAYSGKEGQDDPAVAAALGMGHDETDDDPPLHPFRWREYATASSILAAEGGGPRRPLQVATPRAWMIPPEKAQVLYRDENGRPLAFSFRRWAGRVFAIPASALSNARLDEAGNADLLESLVEALGTQWTFDEFHHGLVSAKQAESGTATTRALDLVLLQLAFVYGLAVLAVARRFGPAWSEPPAVAGSTAAFLRGMGALHHALGHHRAAARLLIERARQMYPRVRFHEPFPGERGEEGLLRLAQDVGRAQHEETT